MVVLPGARYLGGGRVSIAGRDPGLAGVVIECATETESVCKRSTSVNRAPGKLPRVGEPVWLVHRLSATQIMDPALGLLFGLMASGQIRLRRLDSWRQIPAVLSQRRRPAA